MAILWSKESMVENFSLTNIQSQQWKIALRCTWFSLLESSIVAERCCITNLITVGEIPNFAIQALICIQGNYSSEM